MKKIFFVILLLIPLNAYSEEEEGYKNSEIYLENLYIEGYEISPQFDKYNNLYTMITNDDISFLEIVATSFSDDANIQIIGNDSLSDGENTILIRVFCDEENKENIYELIVTIDSNASEPTIKIQNSSVVSEASEKEVKMLIISCLGAIFIAFRVIFIRSK